MDFDEVVKNINNMDCDHEHSCPFCTDKASHTALFVEVLMDIASEKGQLHLQDVVDKASVFYDIVYEQGKRDALEDIMGYAYSQFNDDEDD